MEAILPLNRRRFAPAPYTFLLKILGAIVLVGLADRLFYEPDQAGASLGIFALALLATALSVRLEIWKRTSALLAAGAAAYFAFLLIEDPGLLPLALCWLSISLAVLLPRTARFGSGLQWGLRLLAQTLALPVSLIRDTRLMRAARRRFGSTGIASKLPTLILPVLGSLVFLLLFARANPLIGDALSRLDPLAALSGATFGRLLLWGGILSLCWSVLRPRLRFTTAAEETDAAPLSLPGVTPASVTLSLIAFNAVFALQNALDAAFLWSGAHLPEGMSFAEYAHRGAYPLIVTALLAGLFVILTLRPGSEMAASPLIRRLVSLWIGQNVFLVASTMLRTMRYVQAYSLTELRLEALVWMALVATGLVLICIRLWLGRGDTWLINANLAAAALVLSVSAALDYDRIAAGWNVRHAREAGGPGASLDLCHLNAMGSSALLPLVELEGRRLPAHYRERVTWVRNDIMDRLEARQAEWSGWTWRGARRLASARRAVAEGRLPRFQAPLRQCDGSPITVAAAATPPSPPPPRPLTVEQAR